jgi:hypothetical protein
MRCFGLKPLIEGIDLLEVSPLTNGGSDMELTRNRKRKHRRK